MTGIFSHQAFKLFTMLLVIGIAVSYALPSPAAADADDMVQSDNYDMIMPDNHDSSASMTLQNFDEFYKAENDAMDNMEMDESRLSMVRVPLALSPRERELREHLEDLDVQREKRVQRSLAKGATQPRNNVNDWEKFDYDMLLNYN